MLTIIVYCVCMNNKCTSFTITLLSYSGGVVVHSYGRLVPINFLLTEPEQIEGLDAVGRVNCTTAGAAANFQTDLNNAVSKDSNEDLYQIKNGSTATLIVDNIRRNFMNRQIFCNGLSHFFFLHFSAQGKWGRVNGTHHMCT